MATQSNNSLFSKIPAQSDDDLFADFKPSQQCDDQDLFADVSDSNSQESAELFTEKTTVATPFSAPSWKILIVDDEVDVHQITALILGNYVYQRKPMELLNAYSAQQAKAVLAQHSDIALIFLDVVMETHDAGLQLVRYIRDELKNPWARIILRTGQPGHAPEEKIIIDYEINDYANKTELTRQKLITLTTASLRAYADLVSVESYRQHLEEKVAQRTRELQQKNQELISMNEQLISLNKEKNEFLGIAAHDLKSPLTAILGFAEEIATAFDEYSKAEIIEYANIIKISSERMSSLITNLLDVNVIESGNSNVTLQSLDILPILQNAITLHTKTALSKQITLLFPLPSKSEYFAVIDKNLTQQVLDNLISNAVKYSPQQTQVTVRIYQQMENIVIEIQDQGPGMSIDDQKKLFGKFARLSAQPTGGEHSTGLGLFIVKKLVEAMQGNVMCYSKLGKGCTFTVSFPTVSEDM